jgi:hypothetical protein
MFFNAFLFLAKRCTGKLRDHLSKCIAKNEVKKKRKKILGET